MLNLQAKPYYLDNDSVQWVNETLENMTKEEKCGQLFCEVIWGEERADADRIFEHMMPGGFMFRSLKAEKVHELSGYCQSKSKVPLLIAANLERGGNGIVEEGTYFGAPIACAATDDETHAYRLGLVACKEGAAVGANWSFEPVIDLNFNCLNPITNTRTFGSEPERVLRMAKAYMKGAYEAGCAVSIKHFPGDGIDIRDQHLATTINTMSVDDWENSFGLVYRGMIEAGANTLMAAHIKLPAYSKEINPELADEDIMPGSLSKELLTILLRERMQFNGLIVSDATSMTGFTAVMPREQAVPYSIAAGVDMFLFTVNQKEDMRYMMRGIENGIISSQRLDEAVTRILALKASLKLNEKQKKGELVPPLKRACGLIGCDEHVQWARECADASITLVKNTENILPIKPDKYKRILFRIITSAHKEENDYDHNSVFFKNRLEQLGFEIYDYTHTALPGGIINEMEIGDIKKKYDLILYYACCDVKSNQKDIRIAWSSFLGGDAPKFVKDVPTIFISMANPFHLLDVPMVGTYINAYSPCQYAVEAVIDKITGNSAFKGVNPVDPFCGLWDTRL